MIWNSLFSTKNNRTTSLLYIFVIGGPELEQSATMTGITDSRITIQTSTKNATVVNNFIRALLMPSATVYSIDFIYIIHISKISSN